MQRIFLVCCPAVNRIGQVSPNDILRTRELGSELAEKHGLPRDTILIGGPSVNIVRTRRWLVQGMLPKGGDYRVAENVGFNHVTQGHCPLSPDMDGLACRRAERSGTDVDEIIIREFPDFITKRGQMARACLAEYGQTVEAATLCFVSENASFIVPLLTGLTGGFQPHYSLPHLGVAHFFYDNIGTKQIIGDVEFGI